LIAIGSAAFLLPLVAGSKLVQGDLWSRIHSISPPSDAISLRLLHSFPDEASGGENNLWLPNDMARDLLGNTYIVDYRANSVLKYDKNGKFILTFGRPGQGIGDLSGPVKIKIHGNILVIGESNNRRLQYFTFSGVPIKTVKLFKSIWDFEIDDEGRIYINPMYTPSKAFDENPHLVEIMSPDGIVTRAFGEPLDFKWDDYILNSSMIHLERPDELWVVFSHFPIIRKYSREGTLLAEYRIETTVFKEKEKHNKRMYKKRPREKVVYMRTSHLSRFFKEHLFILDYVPPRIWIYEIDKKGNLVKTYWAQVGNEFHETGMVIGDNGETMSFYILQNRPLAKVDVYVPDINERRFQ
jgi:hypothetical protein